jgi:TP901 family phage tail tape measure protein
MTDLALNILMRGTDISASSSIRNLGMVASALSKGPLAAVAVGAAVVGTAVVGIGVASVKMAADYQKSMNMVQALTGSSNKQMDQYRQGLKELSLDSGVATKKLSDGLYYTISAGYSGAAAMKILTLSTRDAVIGQVDQAVTAKALTTVMQGYSRSIAQADATNGEMLQTITLGRMDMRDYSNAISKTAAGFGLYHVSLETTNAALATLTSSGYKSATVAATGWMQLQAQLVGNTDKVTANIHKLGLAFDEDKFKSMSFTDKLAYLRTVMKGHEDQLQKVLGGSKQAAGVFSMLSQHTAMFAANVKKLSDQEANAKKTQDAWTITQQGLSQSMARLKAAGDELMITIGNALLPVVTTITGKVAPLVAAFTAWVDKSQVLTHALGGIGSAIHDVSTFLGKFDFVFLTSGWKMFSTSLEQARGVIARTGVYLQPLQKMLGSLLTQGILDGIRVGGDLFRRLATFVNDLVQSGTIGTIVDSLRGVASVVQNQLLTNFAAFEHTAMQIGDWWNGTMLPLLAQVQPTFAQLADVLTGVVVPAVLQFWQAGQNLSDHLLPVLIGVLEHGIPFVVQLGAVISAVLSPAIALIAPYVSQAGQALLGFVGDIATRVSPIITQWFDTMSQNLAEFLRDWNAIWPYLAPVVSAAFDIIRGTVMQFFAIISGIVKVALDLLSGNWKQAWKDIQDATTQFVDGAKTAVGQGTDQMKQTGSSNAAQLSSNVSGSMSSMNSSSIGSMQTLSDTGSKLFAQLQQNGVSSMSKLDADTVSYLNNLAGYLDQAQKHIDTINQKTGTLNSRNSHAYAAGTASAAPGLAWVGEKGPELLAMQGGEIVIPAAQSAHLASALAHLPPTLTQAATAISTRVKDTAKGWSDTAGAAISAAASKVTGAASGATSAVGVNVPGNLASWIASAMQLAGAPANWAGALGTIAMAESGGNPSAINLTDSNAAAGTPSQGIMQTIPATFAAYMLPGHGNILNPIDNIIAGIRYIMSRYGSVFNVPGIVSVASGGGYVGYAGGTTNAAAGTALVGEAGRELLVRKKKPIVKKPVISTRDPGALGLLSAFAGDIGSSAAAKHSDAQRLMAGVLSAIARDPALIATDHLRGNRAGETQLRAQLATAHRELTVMKSDLKARGLSYTAKNLKSPINFPHSTANTGALALVDKFTKDIRSSSTKDHAEAERIMGRALTTIKDHPAMIAKAQLQGNKARVKQLQGESATASKELKLFEAAAKARGYKYSTTNTTAPIDFNPLDVLRGSSGSTGTSTGSSTGSGVGSGNFSITNNITLVCKEANAQDVYKVVLALITRDLKRSGALVSTTSGGRS